MNSTPFQSTIFNDGELFALVQEEFFKKKDLADNLSKKSVKTNEFSISFTLVMDADRFFPLHQTGSRCFLFL